MPPQRAIILAAGRGYHVDGANKLLIKNPHTGMTFLQHALKAFSGKRVTVVVGYQSIQVMQDYPELDFVLNEDWAMTNNASSLGLALNEEPCYVVSGDMLYEEALIRELDQAEENLIVVESRENRALSAIHCVVDDGVVTETYQGPIRSIAHPEAIGLFKVTSSSVLREWKRQSLRHSNMFIGQTIPCQHGPIKAHFLKGQDFLEINTPNDYLQLLRRGR